MDMLKIESEITKKAVAAHLLPGEVFQIGFGADYDQAVGHVCVTDKRVYFCGSGMKDKTLSVGLSKIGQVRAELGGWLSNSYLIIEYSGGEAKLRIHGKDECKALEEALVMATL